MKANTVIFTLFISMIAVISACNRPSADKFFQRTVLNTNILHDFAQASFTRTLTSTMVAHKGMPADQQQNNQAQQIVEAKIAYVEQTIGRIEDMTPPDADAGAIKGKSLALYHYVLPVYKKEYMDIAMRCDKKEDVEVIEQLALAVEEKYGEGFENLYLEVLELGKAYAEKHNLNVKFGN